MRARLWLAALLALGAVPAGGQAPPDYPLTADSLVQPGVPRGVLEGPFELHSRVFAGTVRRYWVYVPAGYDPARPPNLLVFQDGQRATNPQGALRIPAVLDKLRVVRKLIDSKGLSTRLEIDGGVKVDNIAEIARAGADTFVAGSAIFGGGDYAKTIAAMRAAIAARP